MHLNLDSYSTHLYKQIFLKYLTRKYFFFYNCTYYPKLHAYAKYDIKQLDELKSNDFLVINSWLFLYKIFLKPFNFVELKNFFTGSKFLKDGKLKRNTKIRKKFYNITSVCRFSTTNSLQLLDTIFFLLNRSKIAEFLKLKEQKSRVCLTFELIKIFPEVNQNLVFDKSNSRLSFYFFYTFNRNKYLKKVLPSLYFVLIKDLTNFISNSLSF